MTTKGKGRLPAAPSKAHARDNSSNPEAHTPRPRCWRCKGRRVIVVIALRDHVELMPCPSCNNNPDPAAPLARDASNENATRAVAA